jgi:lipopolysaccharide export LptBFGC system permease protein LptF
MDTKLKIIIALFVLVVVIYLGSFLYSYMSQVKKREAFMEDDIEEKFTQERKPKSKSENFDQRVVILNTLEKFVEDKDERIGMMSNIFQNMNEYKDLSKDAVVSKVKDYIEEQKGASKVNQDGDHFEEEPAIPDTPVPKPVIKAEESVTPVAPVVPKMNKPTVTEKFEDPRWKESVNKMSTDIQHMYDKFGTLHKDFSELKSMLMVEKMTQPTKQRVQTSTIEHFIDGFENTSSYASYELL